MCQVFDVLSWEFLFLVPCCSHHFFFAYFRLSFGDGNDVVVQWLSATALLFVTSAIVRPSVKFCQNDVSPVCFFSCILEKMFSPSLVKLESVDSKSCAKAQYNLVLILFSKVCNWHLYFKCRAMFSSRIYSWQPGSLSFVSSIMLNI